MAYRDLKAKGHTFKVVYEKFLSELNNARKKLDLYTIQVQSAYIDALEAFDNSDGTQGFDGYDNTLRCFVQVAKSLQQFKAGLSRLTINVIFESAEESIRNVQDKVQTYTYPQPVYCKYTPGCKFNIIITHVKNSEQSLFYINDFEKKNSEWRSFLEHLQYYFNNAPKPLNRLPEKGEVIGLHLEGYMFRIVREDGPIMGDNFKAYLIDVGKVISVTKDMYKKLYVLSTTQKNYSAQAILCKLVAVNSSTDINFKDYLEEHFNVGYQVVVNQRTNHMLYVNLLSKEMNPFKKRSNLDWVNSTQNNESITNLLRKLLLIESAYGNQKSQSKLTEESVDEDTFSRNSSSIVPSSIRFSGNKRETLTEDEMLLYEEVPNTSNAMKAVMDYEPKDDKVICPHARPGKDSCFKGSLCKFEQGRKLKDGWKRDQTVTKIDLPNKIVYPCKGETITLRVMHIVNVEFFFAHIISFEDKYKPTLNELITNMNALEHKIAYKKLENLPARFQHILAKYTDNLWYRAKILNFIDGKTVRVFYLDYGNAGIVALDSIRQWERKFEYLPYQAILCKLDGVKEIPTRAVEGKIFLQTKLMDPIKNIKALVINNNKFSVRLFIGSDDNDVSNLLISRGYAKSFDHADEQQLLPA